MLGQVFEFINTAIDMFLHEVSGPSSQISDPNHFKQKLFSKAYDADFFSFSSLSKWQEMSMDRFVILTFINFLRRQTSHLV